MQIIAFVSGKGGVGKSTLTANVAVALANRNKRVLVIDMDPQNAQHLHMGLDAQETAGLAKEGVSAYSIFDSPFGVDFIPFGVVQDDDLFSFEVHLKENKKWLANGIAGLGENNYDYVLIDTPPGSTTYLVQALYAAHRVLIIGLVDAASPVTIPHMIQLIEEYTKNRTDFIGWKLLLNQMPVHSRLAHQVRATLFKKYLDNIIPIVICRDIGVSQALAFARPVLHYETNCPASHDIRSVADWIIDWNEM